MRPIFNKSFAEKRGLWVSWTVHETYWKNINTLLTKKKKENMKRRNVASIQTDTWLESINGGLGFGNWVQFVLLYEIKFQR